MYNDPIDQWFTYLLMCMQGNFGHTTATLILCLHKLQYSYVNAINHSSDTDTVYQYNLVAVVPLYGSDRDSDSHWCYVISKFLDLDILMTYYL